MGRWRMVMWMKEDVLDDCRGKEVGTNCTLTYGRAVGWQDSGFWKTCGRVYPIVTA